MPDLDPTAATSTPHRDGGNRIDLIRPDAPQLARPGAMPVGVQTLHFVHCDQIDVAHVRDASEPRYDRPLTVEIWYPAAPDTAPGGSYRTLLRDGRTEVTLSGRAARDAAPSQGTRYPLIVISHGYPGNRHLMSHLGEHLATKGYVVVAIEHTDSTYSDQGTFGATLYHRPLDQRFVIEEMAALTGPLGAIVDADRVGVIGYSMGGYGALVLGGAGVTQAATGFDWSAPNGLLMRHRAGSSRHEALADPRVKAMMVIGPWGYNAGIWDAQGLAGLRVPTLLVAGSADDVSDYRSIRTIFEQSTGAQRHLLTFAHANHNAAAPIPAPAESWVPVDTLDFVPFEHYADAVWDSVRMNNIAQHFATAFFGVHVRGDASLGRFLSLCPVAEDGILALDETGRRTPDDTYWEGFAPRTAKGLLFETRDLGV